MTELKELKTDIENLSKWEILDLIFLGGMLVIVLRWLGISYRWGITIVLLLALYIYVGRKDLYKNG